MKKSSWMPCKRRLEQEERDRAYPSKVRLEVVVIVKVEQARFGMAARRLHNPLPLKGR